MDISDILNDFLIFSPREFNSEACGSQREAEQRVAVRNKGPVLPDFLTLQEKQEVQSFIEFLLIVATGSQCLKIN